jgi:hypothetical protein
LNKITRPHGQKHKLLQVWLIVTVLGLILIGRGCICRPTTDFPGAHFNRGANAVWLGVEWVKEPHGKSEITALAHNLQQRQIRFVYVFVSYLKSEGEFNKTYAQAPEFVRGLKAAQPDLNVQAWIGLPLKRLGIPRSGWVDLGDAMTRQKITAFCADITRLAGFDGVHLDPEPVPNGDANVLTLLNEIRYAIGPNSTLSIATPRIQPIFPDIPLPFVGWVTWSASYYQEVAKRVNQMAVMVYDSGLPLPTLYRQWGHFQVIEISRAVDGMDVDLLFGIPTSEEKTGTHWPSAENMTSGLQGVIDGLNDTEARASAVTGVAIYPYWETNATKWATYESLWLGQ